MQQKTYNIETLQQHSRFWVKQMQGQFHTAIDKVEAFIQSKIRISVDTLPIPAYDDLNVRRILRYLSRLDAEQLELVQKYEQNNKNRITILTEINARL